MSQIDELTLVPQPTKDDLNKRQLLDYRSQREDCLEWLLTVGKNPEKAEGYAFQTVSNRAYRMDMFYRWVWKQENGYTADVMPNHADDWLEYLARLEKSNAHKDNCRKAVRMLFKWRHHEYGIEKWEPKLSFSTTGGTTAPRDYLTKQERSKIREAALEYGSIPDYNNLDPQERSRWKAYLAQRFEKPKSEISPVDWERANGWKIPSLVWVSLDAGLRPIEVERAVIAWADPMNGVLRIPKEDSSKNEDNWLVSLQDRTAEILGRWLREREAYMMYDDTDALWLTRQGNRYQSATLRHVLNRLCEIAEIDTEHRQMSWYTIRHSTGTYMTREEDLAAAQAQLRHKSPETTMRYDQVPIEDRRDALDRMG
jgi:site-specific recombinase XerD